MLGPLYHLQRREERLWALEEARRVLRPGGLTFCAAISRYASLFDGYYYRMIDDPEFRAIIARDLAAGEHVNPTEKDYFTDAYFHTPAELEAEIAEAGYELVGMMGVEGFGRLLPDFDALWADADRRRRLLDHLREIERAPSLLGMSAHLLAVARKPG